jgi:pantoate--beta-alanine ligase
MQICHTVADLHRALDALRARGPVGLVPTMGNLHQGHLELARRSTLDCAATVVSIFVNPMQFGPTEDFASYPRTLEQDAEQLSVLPVDVIFAPPDAEIYPHGRDGHTSVSVPRLAGILCGAHRPGHFDGVATVVLKLFNLVRPNRAYFGEKDYQQLAVIRTMVGDLNVPVDVIGVPTVRADDGLALSSRNQYLDAEERRRAPALYAALRGIGDALRRGRRDFRALEQRADADLRAAGFVPDYVSVRRASDLAEPTSVDRAFVVLAAARLGRARLIDNYPVEV